ncbi:MAG: 16S rRNA (cytidine(1402)-2'-O)-methyltransferase [Candidatus Glassbacteria bacterium]|nr:16S rRNA (cytidine(1402)-2'-O)-methyltransferase [Candidatus Glassbacteria bacterium]
MTDDFTVKPGCLYVVATPLGNLNDITFRAVEILRAVDIIACEDTRHSRKLFSRHGISAKLISYHQHNERTAAARICGLVAEGRTVALVTDAGTPGISDPGYRLARLAAESDITVVPVPGPSALTAALSAAGLPTDSFYFAGFLPPRQKATEDTFHALKEIEATLVFFCPARRVAGVLETAASILGERRAAVCREMTKIYEEIARGSLASLAVEYAEREEGVRGEVVLVVEGKQGGDARLDMQEVEERLSKMLESVEDAAGLGARQLAAMAAEKLGVRRNRLYPLVCAWLNEHGAAPQ